ncbi:hypothetical protein B0H14DRAFT_3175308 [Mycena olivaceomarginata]|nr:hypothetical protein B0H14DRAFT_3175308 [Mycena olivaceomarginata]
MSMYLHFLLSLSLSLLPPTFLTQTPFTDLWANYLMQQMAQNAYLDRTRERRKIQQVAAKDSGAARSNFVSGSWAMAQKDDEWLSWREVRQAEELDTWLTGNAPLDNRN